MWSIGPLSDWRERFGSADRAIQRGACDQAIEHFASDPSFQDELNALLRDSNPRVQFSSAFVLFRTGRQTLRLLPALLDCFELEDGDLRWSAAHMLAVLGRLHGEVLPVLSHETANGETAQRRRMALYALRELGPERSETEAAVLQALDDSDLEVQRAALACMAKLTEPSAAALQCVLSIADTTADAKLRRIAIVVLPDLVRHHPDSLAPVREQIQRGIQDPDVSLQRAANAAASRLPH